MSRRSVEINAYKTTVLIIGNSKYNEESKNLVQSANDAVLVKEMFKERFKIPKENIKVLENCTKLEFESETMKIKKQVVA